MKFLSSPSSARCSRAGHSETETRQLQAQPEELAHPPFGALCLRTHVDYLFWSTEEPFYTRDVLPYLRELETP